MSSGKATSSVAGPIYPVKGVWFRAGPANFPVGQECRYTREYLPSNYTLFGVGPKNPILGLRRGASSSGFPCFVTLILTPDRLPTYLTMMAPLLGLVKPGSVSPKLDKFRSYLLVDY